MDRQVMSYIAYMDGNGKIVYVGSGEMLWNRINMP